MTHYKVLDNENNVYEVDDLEQFCKERDLLYSSMVRVANGYAKIHKGYWIYHVDPEMYERAKQNRKNLKMETKRRERGELTTVVNTITNEEVTFDKLVDFCETHGLSKAAISMVVKGVRKTHKGWMLKEEK